MLPIRRTNQITFCNAICCSYNPQKLSIVRGGTCIIVDTYTCEYNNVLNPALPKAVVAGRNNDGFSKPNRRGNMKGTRVKRYKMPIYFLIYFCLCAFFSITFPRGPSGSQRFSLSQMCVGV